MGLDTNSIAITGLKDAATRIAVSANNIANSQSVQPTLAGSNSGKAFIPQDVVSISQEASGGVQTQVVDGDAQPFQVFDPQSQSANADGFVERPNVDFAEEATNRILAESAFKANISVIKADTEAQSSLLDALA